jgi:hypothetical protein
MKDRPVRVGDYITMVHVQGRKLVIAYVCATAEQAADAAKRVGLVWVPIDALVYETEGVWWARGTEGKDVDALKAAQALE